MKHLILFFPLLFMLGGIHGHGGLVSPYTWYDPTGIQTDRVMDNRINTGRGPTIGCWSDEVVVQEGIVDWSRDELCHIKWFSNNTRPPGPRTLPKDMFNRGPWKWNSRSPWAAPGTAPVFGPCGTAGGNPNGCGGGPKGTCCGGDCKAYAYGKNAIDYQFDNAKRTTWTRGTNQEVVWWQRLPHYGGYSYRLCKLPPDGIISLTEECFQRTPLDFADPQEIRRNSRGKFRTPSYQVKRTRIGTSPANSMWTKVQVGFNHYIKDWVNLPSSLTPGRYVLSLRWDAENLPQVWSGCSNIDIV